MKIKLTPSQAVPSNFARILCAFLGFVLSLVPAAFSQGTAFTYQGRLTENSLPAQGSYDLSFSLFNSPAAAVPMAGPVINSAVAVSNGLFSVTLNFGAASFDGGERWLEVRAGTNGASVLQALSPRQLLTATPYAVRALSAGSVPSGAISGGMLADGAVTASKLAPGAVSQLGASDGVPAAAVSVDASGRMGIGTTTPEAGLEINTTAAILSARRAFQVRDESSGYTNLNGANSMATFNSLVAVSGYNDDG